MEVIYCIILPTVQRDSFDFLEWKFQPRVVKYRSSNLPVLAVRILSLGITV